MRSSDGSSPNVFLSHWLTRQPRSLPPYSLASGCVVGARPLPTQSGALLQDSSIPPDNRSLLQVDLINAFNSYDRETAFREVRRLFPEAARWVEYTYGNQADLVFGNVIIKSCQGGHQGDPLVGLIFCCRPPPCCSDDLR